MSRNLNDLIAVAAQMRAAGYSWEAVATAVHRQPTTCQKWPTRHPARWEPLYRAAQLQRFDEIHNEVSYHLNTLLRDGDKKVKTEAIKVWLRCAPAAFARHHELVAPARGPEYDAQVEQARARLAQEKEQSDCLRRKLDGERRAAGLPPLTDDEFEERYLNWQ